MVLGYLIMLQHRRQSFYQNQMFLKTTRINLWSSKSNAFSMFIVTKYSPILLQSHIWTISGINLPPSPINLLLIYAVCCVEIKLERKIFNFSERAFEERNNKEMSRQFLMYLLSLSFLSINLIIAIL